MNLRVSRPPEGVDLLDRLDLPVGAAAEVAMGLMEMVQYHLGVSRMETEYLLLSRTFSDVWLKAWQLARERFFNC